MIKMSFGVYMGRSSQIRITLLRGDLVVFLTVAILVKWVFLLATTDLLNGAKNSIPEYLVVISTGNVCSMTSISVGKFWVFEIISIVEWWLSLQAFSSVVGRFSPGEKPLTKKPEGSGIEVGAVHLIL